MKEIPLSKFGKNKGKYVALVNDEDYDYLMQFDWSAKVESHTIYAYRNIYKDKVWVSSISMHRDLMKVTDPKIKIDHRDHNGLNCQRTNMRECTHADNMKNMISHKDGTSKFVGVSWFKKYSKWRAVIMKDGKQVFCGYHATAEDAARAYDKKAIELFGTFANFNFPSK